MFNDAELSLIKNTFGGDGEDFLYLIRNVLLQFPLTNEEKATLKSVMNAEVYAVVKKKILPSIDPDAPFGQLGDLYQTLAADLKAKTPEDMQPLFEAAQLQVDYLTQQFEYLMDVEREFEPKIKLDNLKLINRSSFYETFVNQRARNFILSYVDTFLIQLKTLAGQKDETPEKQKERLTRDSSK